MSDYLNILGMRDPQPQAHTPLFDQTKECAQEPGVMVISYQAQLSP